MDDEIESVGESLSLIGSRLIPYTTYTALVLSIMNHSSVVVNSLF